MQLCKGVQNDSVFPFIVMQTPHKVIFNGQNYITDKTPDIYLKY